jgi:hypothetical protein
MNWILVSEGLPERHTPVIVAIGKPDPVVGVARLVLESGHSDATCWIEFAHGPKLDVTHWMPLPSPPTDSEA